MRTKKSVASRRVPYIGSRENYWFNHSMTEKYLIFVQIENSLRWRSWRRQIFLVRTDTEKPSHWTINWMVKLSGSSIIQFNTTHTNAIDVSACKRFDWYHTMYRIVFSWSSLVERMDLMSSKPIYMRKPKWSLFGLFTYLLLLMLTLK